MSETRSLRISRRTLARTGITAAAGLAAIQTGVGRTHAKQDGEVTFMNWDAVPGTPLEMALNMFQEETGISVNVQPAPTEDYTTKMRTLLASGSPPDVMRIDDDLVRGFAEANQLLDLGEMLEGSNINTDEFTEPLFTFPIQADDSRPAWVIGTQPRVFFYNVDMFEELGVPLPPSTWTAEGWTWDDFLETAKQLTDASEQRWGALIYGDNAYEQTFSVNNGVEGGIYSPDGAEFTLATDKGVEAVQWVTDLTCVHEVQPPWSQLQQDQARQQLFASGRIGMLFGAFGLVPYFRDNVADFTWDVAPVPAREEQKQEGSLIVFCIPQDAANPEAAWQLLTFLSGEAGGNIFAENGYFIPILPNSAELISPGEEAPANIKLFTEAAQHQSSVSPSTYQEQAEQIYRPQLDLVYNCEQSAADVLPPLKEQIEQALAGEG
jgi:multiple sugar transport system substrate-binding protein